MRVEQLKQAMQAACISQRQLARAAGLSARAINDLVCHGEFPKRQPQAKVRQQLRAALDSLGVTDLDGLFGMTGQAEMVTAQGSSLAPSDAAPAQSPPFEKGGPGGISMEMQMLITKRSLSNAAREAFGLPGNALQPPTQANEVFLGGEMRVGFEHLLAKARFGGMLALAGESGAGKTTLKDLLVTELNRAGEVIVIEPHVQAMEANDKAGKTLKAAAIVEAIMREVASTEKLRASSEARLAQVEAALARSADADMNRRHLLVIDEAHCLPIPTLKHLKRFCEFKRKGRGLQPALLTIVLLGQPELRLRLSSYDQEVREVWQRCELVTLRPLERDLAAYLKHRLGAAAAAFDATALDALTLALTEGGKSYCYPLAIDNWLAEILNTAARVGARQISAETVNAARKAVQKRTQEGV